MTRVLRYPRSTAAVCVMAVLCALMRDVCVGAGQYGWARVLLVVTLSLLALCLVLLSSRFVVDVDGVGVGFLFGMRRAAWEDIAAFGVLYCNSRRRYFYGMYRGATDFLSLLHHAPRCGRWGFVVPAGEKLMRAVGLYCPFDVDVSMPPRARREGRLRLQWHQAAFYLLAMIPCAALAFVTGGLMLLRASQLSAFTSVIVLTLGALALFAAGLMLLHRVLDTALTCPAFNEQGIRSGVYLPWDAVCFGYVHRVARISGMFLLSRPLDEVKRRGAKPIVCLSMPDTSTLMLAYLTYCPHAAGSEWEE